ncbi:translesion DNA synthesis-associated protein ImuA, partial [Achromobacter insolitus]
MQSPERIHPALWRATQLAQGAARTLPTGHAALSAELPDGGWPLGSLNELLVPHPGIGEIRLLRPALAQLETRRAIALVQPPHVPHIASWMSWRLDPRQLLWVAPEKPVDALWAAEQILKNGSCGALICWLPHVRPESLRRLHLAAQASDLLFIAVRPSSAAQNATPAPLRLALAPAAGGLSVHILKRRGPACDTPLYVGLEPGAT